MLLTVPTYTKACDTFRAIWDTKLRRYSGAGCSFLVWPENPPLSWSLLCQWPWRTLPSSGIVFVARVRPFSLGLLGNLDAEGLQYRPGNIHACAFLIRESWALTVFGRHIRGYLVQTPTRSSSSLCLNLSDHGELLTSHSECGSSELLNWAPMSISMCNLSLGLGSAFRNSQNASISLTCGSPSS